jgi:hypothetical protein
MNPLAAKNMSCGGWPEIGCCTGIRSSPSSRHEHVGHVGCYRMRECQSTVVRLRRRAGPESALLAGLNLCHKWRKRWLSNNAFLTGPSRFFYANAHSNLLVLTGSALQEINSFAKVAIKRGAIGIVRGLV